MKLNLYKDWYTNIIDFTTSRITFQEKNVFAELSEKFAQQNQSSTSSSSSPQPFNPFGDRTPSSSSSSSSTGSESIVNLRSPNSSVSSTKKIEVIHKYILHCNFTRNNTHLTLTGVTEDINYLNRNPNLSYNQQVLYYAKLPEKVKIALSGGNVGFRKSARGEYEAGFQASAKMFSLMEQKGFLDKDLEIIIKNFGKGREAFLDALKGKEGGRIRGKVVRVSDDTRLKFGGTRSPRRRRLWININNYYNYSFILVCVMYVCMYASI